VLAENSISKTSHQTYGSGFNKFLAYLDVANLSLTEATTSLRTTQLHTCRFAVWLFLYEGFQVASIKNYIAAISFLFFVNHITTASLWNPFLNRVVKGIERECAREKPAFNRCKLPFTRTMIIIAWALVLDCGSCFELRAIHAALCMGFMFLFRKSEYLTDDRGRGKMNGTIPVTLLADNVLLWYGNTSFPSTARNIPLHPPEFLSIFLPFSKSDQFGKGASRFFPADSTCPTCMVKIVHAYIVEADLQPGNYFFAGPRFIVSASTIAKTIKRTAERMGLPANRLSNHSIRIGGLVSVFAAEVPDNLKQLAGRWASADSFIAYARATMQQFTTIASALNRIDLVTPEHVRRFYM
jgi:hypothetical protein